MYGFQDFQSFPCKLLRTVKIIFFAKIIKPGSASIEQIQIIGHTSQGAPDKKNNINTDRELSAMRSAVVTAYLQKKNVIDPAKLFSSAYGHLVNFLGL